MEITVKLDDRWAGHLRGLVSDRRFDSTDHAPEESLRLLEVFEDREERLARLLDEGERSDDAGSWDLDAFLTERRERDGGRKAA